MEALKEHDNATHVANDSGIDFNKIATYMKIENPAQQNQLVQQMHLAARQLQSGECGDVRKLLKHLGLTDGQLHIALEAIHAAVFPKDRVQLPA